MGSAERRRRAAPLSTLGPSPARHGERALVPAPDGAVQNGRWAGWPEEVAHPSIDERKAKGLEARDRALLSSHAKWHPAADRPDPVALLEEQDTPASRTWCRCVMAG